MTITKILKSENSATEKLEQLEKVVISARKEYGNTEVEVEVPTVNTADGVVSIKYLDAQSKIQLVEKVVRLITTEVVELCEENEALVFDKEVERQIASNSILCNLLASTNSKYI